MDAEGKFTDTEEEFHRLNMEMATGLSEIFEALRKISAGDLEVRIPEESETELIAKLRSIVNATARKDLA